MEWLQTASLLFGIPTAVIGAFIFVRSIVHGVEALQRIAISLDREATGNGYVSRARDVLGLDHEPTTKELVSALVVSMLK